MWDDTGQMLKCRWEPGSSLGYLPQPWHCPSPGTAPRAEHLPSSTWQHNPAGGRHSWDSLGYPGAPPLHLRSSSCSAPPRGAPPRTSDLDSEYRGKGGGGGLADRASIEHHCVLGTERRIRRVVCEFYGGENGFREVKMPAQAHTGRNRD